MNWGKGIILVFSIFAIFVIYFIVKMIQTNTFGIPDRYYEKGLNHQTEIDASEGISEFEPELGNTSGTVYLIFKKNRPDSGNILLQWPPNPSQNVVHNFKALLADTLRFSVHGNSGFRNAEVVFYSKGKRYIYHKRLWVN